MKFAGGVFTTICAVTGIVAGVGARYYAQPAAVTHIQIVSSNPCVQARTYAQTLVDRHRGVSFRPHHIIDLVQELLPALDTVTVRKKDGAYVVAVVQQKPISLVNQQFVVTDRGLVVDKNQFDPQVVNQLFSYTTAQQLSVHIQHKEHVQFVRTFDSSLLTAYEVVWVNPTRVELVDAHDKTMRIVVSADMQLPLDFSKTYQELKKEIKSLPAKKGRTWQVDMRFKNQILVC